MKELSLQELETMLCSTGYLPPRCEEELLFFNQLYEGYKSRLAEKHIDVESIINGTCRVVATSSHNYELSNVNNSFVADNENIYSMAARNYEKLPKDIVDKMKNQHKSDDNDEE